MSESKGKSTMRQKEIECERKIKENSKIVGINV